MTNGYGDVVPGIADHILKPGVSLLIKLGSLVVHADEFLSPRGHPYDKEAFAQLLADAEVQTWIADMRKMAFLPVKRHG